MYIVLRIKQIEHVFLLCLDIMCFTHYLGRVTFKIIGLINIKGPCYQEYNYVKPVNMFIQMSHKQ